MAAVRLGWNEAAPVFHGFHGSPGAEEEPATAQDASAGLPARLFRQGSRQPFRVKRPGLGAAAATAAGPSAAGTAPQPAPQPATSAAQQQEQHPPAPFMFSTPGAGPASTATKARRSRTRTPAASASPAFSLGSTASMAWSPYPGSSGGEASTAFGAAASPQAPGSATPCSAPAPPASAQSPAPGRAATAADLRSRMDESAAEEGSRPGGAVGQSIADALRQQLNLGRRPDSPEAAPAPAHTSPRPSAEAAAQPGFSFIFGSAAAAAAAALTPRAGRPGRKKSPSSSPGVRTPLSKNPAGPAFQAAFGSAQPAAQPEPAPFRAAAPADVGAAVSHAAAGGSTGAPPAGGFVFGATSGTPAAQRARRLRPQRSPSTASPPAATSARSAAPGWSPLAAQAATAAAAPKPGPQRENEQPQGQPPSARAAADGGKDAVATPSPTFSAAGGSARRPPRRRPPHTARLSPAPRSSGSHSTASPPPRPAQAAPAAAAAAAAAPPSAASGPGWDAATQAAYSTSEMYRSQGNEAFRDGVYDLAHSLYTQALQALWPHPPLHPRLALLLSNRAASFLSQGKPLSALADCQMGLKYDPGLLRCALRVATCHSRMGDFDKAFRTVAALRDAAAGDEERLAEVAAKQRDLQEQERQMYDALRMLGHALAAPKRDPASGAALSRSGSSSSAGSVPAAPATAEAFWAALRKVDEVAPHVPHSELLLAAKAEGLLRLGRLDKAREFCQQAVHLDGEEVGAQRRRQALAPWRLWVQAQASWQDGDADGTLRQLLSDLLAALERRERGPGADGAAASSFFPAAAGGAGAAASFPAAEGERRCEEQVAVVVGLPGCEEVRSLLQGLEKADALRQAGNAAVRAGRAAEAVQKYSEALAVGCLSPFIAAVLLSNRSAAHQHLKQRAQAVADCSRAAALNPNYAKASSRLATLLSELGRHSDAAAALEAACAAKGVAAADKRDYQQRLASERGAAQRASSRGALARAPVVDHYKLLGLERSATAEDVRRSYKKLALQLHPDKAAAACRVAPRCAGCGAAAFEAAAALERLQERATWLFKLLGEANEVLSDPSKRRELDTALAMWGAGPRSASAGGFGSYTSYYADDSDEESSFPSFFGGVFGRRGSAHAGYGGGYSGYSGYGGGGYGGAHGYGGYGRSASSRGRNWGF